MGRVESPHEQLPVVPQSAADLPTGAGGGKAVGTQLHQVVAAGNISPCGCDAAAGVLDQGPGDDIRPHRHRFFPLHKLPVAVVHHDNGLRRLALGDLHNGGNVLHPQGRPQAVAPGALNVDHLVLGGDAPLHGLQVRHAVGPEGKLLVLDAELLQGAGLFPALHAYDPLNGVIGSAGNAQHLVSRTKHAEEGHSQGVGAADKVVAHQGVLGAQGGGVNLVQHVTAPVSVTVAGAAHKVALADPRLVESRQHFLLVVPLDLLDLPELGLGQLLRPLGGFQQLGGNLKIGIYVHVPSPHSMVWTQVSTLVYPRAL